MGLDHFFSKDLVFCLEADNQEQLFDQVATLLEEKESCYGYLSIGID